MFLASRFSSGFELGSLIGSRETTRRYPRGVQEAGHQFTHALGTIQYVSKICGGLSHVSGCFRFYHLVVLDYIVLRKRSLPIESSTDC